MRIPAFRSLCSVLAIGAVGLPAVGAAQTRSEPVRSQPLAHVSQRTGAVANAAAPVRPPRLIVAISVDQFSSELFNRYRATFTEGLKRLSTGAVFTRGYQGHAATETCPGHSTLLTGMFPAHTGIIANNWFDQSLSRADKRVYCAENPAEPGSTSGKYVASPDHLMVATLGDIMRGANPASRNVAVSGKDRATLMMGGRNIRDGFWWGGEGFVARKGVPLPQTVIDTNRVMTDRIAQGFAGMTMTPACQRLARRYQAGDATVGDGRFVRKPGDAKALRGSPELDAATGALATALVRDMKLGQGSAPDLLSVSFSATDYIGHGLGTNGSEMCLQMQALDETIGGLFAYLDEQHIDYAVVLSADHGGIDMPERLRDEGSPDAHRVSDALTPANMSLSVARALGMPASGTLLLGDSPHGDIYANVALSPADRARVLAEAVRQYRAQPDVAAVFTAREIARIPMPQGAADRWTLPQRVRASYYAGRSGDLVVQLKPRVSPIVKPGVGYVATHGSPWDYDRTVPILFWWPGIAASDHREAINTADIMPTLASWVGLRPSGTIDGRCLTVGRGKCPR